MKTLTTTELAETVALHGKWLRNEAGGVRADLRAANLSAADLSDADLSDADLRAANLSQSKSIPSAAQWLDKNFEHDNLGVIVYRRERGEREAPASWKFEPGSFIEETPNPTRTQLCGCGVSFATRGWVDDNYSGPIWKCRIRWIDLADTIVPYNSDGKARCRRLELIEKVEG